MTAALLVIASMLLAWPGGTCPPASLCAPTVGIYGPITPYTDATGREEVGLGIRELTYVSPQVYLVGHAYTQFWAVAMLQPGDVVYAFGVGYRITGRFVQYACQAPAQAPAALSLQTSLSTDPCGPVVVVQAERQ